MSLTLGEQVIGSEEFRQNFKLPIEKGRSKDATDDQKKAEQDAVNRLREKFLNDGFLQRRSDLIASSLPPKEEITAWLAPSTTQRSLLTEMCGELFESKKKDKTKKCRKCPLSLLLATRLTCNHPLLTDDDDDLLATQDKRGGLKSRLQDFDVEEVFRMGPKVEYVLKTLKDPKYLEQNHKAIVTSEFTQTLDIFEWALKKQGIPTTRFDGTISGKKRSQILRRFNDPHSETRVLLLSKLAGGIGLNIQGANFIFIVEPAWNPCTDIQAIARSHRIGQKRPVTVIRLAMAGTVEEKVYMRQIHKDGIIRTVLTKEQLASHFDEQELKRVFTVGKPGVCEFLKDFPKQKIHPHNRPDLPLVSSSVSFVIGYSRHEGFYQQSSASSSDENICSDDVWGSDDEAETRVTVTKKSTQASQSRSIISGRSSEPNNQQMVDFDGQSNVSGSSSLITPQDQISASESDRLCTPSEDDTSDPDEGETEWDWDMGLAD